MHVLKSTTDGQGTRKNDFSFTDEGELVYIGMECGGNERIDGGCGCRRSFSGMESHKATTTAKVWDAPKLTLKGLTYALRESLEEAGWLPGLEEEQPGIVREMAEDLAGLAAHFRVGDIVEKRGNTLRQRVVA